MRLIFFCFLSIGFLFNTFSLSGQSDTPLLRYPALNSDGSTLSFSYQGDIWTVPTTGGTARRLTLHESYEAKPQWSPDDKHILFIGNRFGNDDLFLTNASGGRPTRLTYFSRTDSDARWGKNGQITFISRRAFAEVERENEIFEINQKGGTPVRSLEALGLTPAPSPDGRYVAFVRGTCRVAREAYTGPANRDIWLYDSKNNTYTQISDHDSQDINPDWDKNNNLYFLSARSGRYNVHKVKIENGRTVGNPIALTNFSDLGVRHFDVSLNGEKITIERGNQLLLMDAREGSNPQVLQIDVTSDYRFDPIEKKTYSKNLQQYALSPNGKYIAQVIRGELFITTEDPKKKRSKRLTNHAARDQDIQWLNDETLLFTSDRNGNYDIYMIRSADPNEPNLFKSLKYDLQAITNTPDDESDLIMAPNRKKLAYRRKMGQLVVVDIDSIGQFSNEQILVDGWDPPSDISWSPDSRWLAYALDDLDFNEEVFIQAADNTQPAVNVSMHPRSDDNPVWSKDGSKLGFLSNRNNGDADVWFVWLKKEDWEKTKRDWEETDEETEKKDTSNAKKKKVLEIDFENIHERLQQVTRMPGNERNLAISKDGETIYFSANSSGGFIGNARANPSFHSVKWDGTELKTLLDNTSVRQLSWDKAQKAIYYLTRSRTLSKFETNKKKSTSLPFTAQMTIDHENENRQIFDEAWRAINDRFYDPNFHGRNWSTLREKYKDIALTASTSQDFRDIFNEMLGQINASHMGLYGSNPEETQKDQTGRLGIEFTPTAEGVKITRIVPNTPADREDSKLAVGEVIKSINGTAITLEQNFYELLNGTVNERTLLEVTGTDGSNREIVIRPASSINSALYENWIKERKRLTEEYSNGRLGYIHIRGMDWNSFERFQRELMASGYQKDGIVIDVRFNGGGWTTDMLMTILNVRQHAYTIPRGAAGSLEREHLKFRDHYPFGERLAYPAWTKPSVTLCNENSYSNAEIFSHAFKTLGLGTLVGQPTFGAVISTSAQSLINGSYVRLPFRAWYVKATDENMEHGPAVPDIIVENAPNSKAKGEDLQLKKAVEALLQQMDAKR